MTQKIQERYENFSKAFDRLSEALNIYLQDKNNAIVRDSVIQRFEFTFELTWKLQKDILTDEGFEPKSPKETVTEAFKFELIDNPDIWFDMIQSRNLSSHTYNQDFSQEMGNKITDYYFDELVKFRQKIEAKYGLS